MSANNASSANGQSSGKNDGLVFRGESSSSKRKNSDYFIKPEDIERRKRQEERESENRQRKLRREASKKQEAKVDTTIDSKTAAKNVARSEKRQLRKLAHEQGRVRFASSVSDSRKNVAKFFKWLFTGKKVFAYLIILGAVVLVAFNGVLYKKVILPERERIADNEYAEFLEKESPIVDEIGLNIAAISMNGGSGEDLDNYYKETLKKYDENSGVYFTLAVKYGEFLGRKKGLNEGVNYLTKLEGKAKAEYQKEYLYFYYYLLYNSYGETKKADEYAAKFNAMKRRAIKNSITEGSVNE